MFEIAGGILLAVVALCLAPYILTAIFWVFAGPFFIPGLVKRAIKGDPHKI
jgi:hypothetical protein